MSGAIAAIINAARDIVKGVPGVVRSRQKRRILRRMLKDARFKWRNIDQLRNAIAESDQNTRKLLVSINARPSETDPNLWGLISRVGATGGH